MNRSVLPFTTEKKADPVTAKANAVSMAPPELPTSVVHEDLHQDGSRPSSTDKLWTAFRSLSSWKAAVFRGAPSIFTTATHNVDGALSMKSGAKLLDLEEDRDDHVFLPIIPELAADGQSKNLKGETIVGAVCDIRNSPSRILRVSAFSWALL
ncbi:unnamed protein product [Ixodes pacificus]